MVFIYGGDSRRKVQTEDIEDNAVTTPKLANGSVTLPKLGFTRKERLWGIAVRSVTAGTSAQQVYFSIVGSLATDLGFRPIINVTVREIRFNVSSNTLNVDSVFNFVNRSQGIVLLSQIINAGVTGEFVIPNLNIALDRFNPYSYRIDVPAGSGTITISGTYMVIDTDWV